MRPVAPVRPPSATKSSPPAAGRLVRVGALIGALGLTLACNGDGPVEPADGSGAQLAERPKGPPRGEVDDDALAIADLIDDPLFLGLVHGIDAPSLSEPVIAALDALTSGRLQRARNLIVDASVAAEALEDDPSAATALIYWSAIERYFEEAELI